MIPESELVVYENVWIPMPDGIQLAAKVWLPPDAEENPVPAIVEYIPYRKRDLKSIRDARIHAFFAQRGYAGIRVDLRGSGDSEGVLYDEYLQQEQDDGLTILKWLAEQPWCTGKVGLFGLSWGGFNGLQIAALQPPELGAVITVCSSDDRYVDDVHYMGGCLLTDNLSWASTMFAHTSCPPDPAVVGDRWREMWLERLENSGLWLKTWLEHPHRDDFWRHASVCEDYSAVQVPVMAVSGWADGYSNSVFRLMQHLQVPRKGLVGPWGHKYPHENGIGPDIDFLGECVRWWDQWLKGIDRGIEDEPMLRVWMQDFFNPIEAKPKRPGRWVAEESWHDDYREHREYILGPQRLLPADEVSPEDIENAQDAELTLQSPLSVGLFAGKWASYSSSTDLPWDQRSEDGGALVFDTEPLTAAVEILGSAVVELTLKVDKPIAQVAVRLSDIAPDDRATRVTFGILNLAHRESHAHPTRLEPGQRYRVRVPLNYVAQRFPEGHRIRVALSTSYWPLAWPAPEPVQMTVCMGESRLWLPVRQPKPIDDQLKELGKARTASAPGTTLLAPAKREWTVSHNLASTEVALNVVNNDPRLYLHEIDLSFGRNVRERYTYHHNDYNTVRGEVETEREFERGDWKVYTITRTILTSTPETFIVTAVLDAYEGDKRIFSKTWDESIPRKLV